ncbi:hypothetical protein SAMN05192529_10213 [Arachidicoccus rhizosphaerae]|uniref:Methyltransferase domain-containing protein n=2 Tax=Arachidicoccus rhizosphaerae TaxID=551991 RepID=A0A1H3W038_9BACT|nr:hypothetical protein SAMN05192529_10213 [Arachidicoccus rhizosphaerae]
MDLLKHGWSLMVSPDSWLVQIGYVNSFISGEPVDLFYNPVPWMNYSLFSFLAERINKNFEVFEFGSGNSTLFFAKHVRELYSIEYDKKWFDLISKKIIVQELNNVRYIYCELGNAYSNKIVQIDTFFDMVIIDGRQRVECAIRAYSKLKDSGVLILDDSDRVKYKEIFDFYQIKGFAFVTFSSVKPNGFGAEYSTIFYKKGENILGL